jgi:hypothetical protein
LPILEPHLLSQPFFFFFGLVVFLLGSCVFAWDWLEITY